MVKVKKGQLFIKKLLNDVQGTNFAFWYSLMECGLVVVIYLTSIRTLMAMVVKKASRYLSN